MDLLELLIGVFHNIGSIVAIVLGVMKIREIRDKSANAELVKVEEAEYWCERDDKYQDYGTHFSLEIDIRNRGQNPTDLVEARFEPEGDDISEMKLLNNRGRGGASFEKKRFEGKSRDKKRFFSHAYDLVDEGDEKVEGSLILEFTDQQIENKVCFKLR